MRLREALRLRKECVDLDTGKITLGPEDVKTGSRTGKGRNFIMGNHTLERIRQRFKNVSDPVFVFPSSRAKGKAQDSNKTAWKTAKRAAKIKGRARWHDLRHTALTIALLEKRINPVAVSEYAGVALPTIQRVYLHGEAEKTKDVGEAVRIDGL